MNLRTALLATAFVAAGTVGASAQGVDWNKFPMGVYISGMGGANWASDRDISNPAGVFGTINNNANIDMSTGWAAGGAVGYSFSNGANIELEVANRRNSLDEFSTTGLTGGLDGRLSQLSVMVNFLYNIALGMPLYPYVGVGVGGVRNNVSNARPNPALPGQLPQDRVDGSDWGFGFQGILGLGYYITENLSLQGRYSYLHSPKIKGLDTVAGGITLPDSKVDSGGNHAALAVLRYDFGARPRVMPAAAPVAPPIQRNFMVFFDHDRADITTEAQRVIVQAANNAKQGNVTRIMATGHADRSGQVQYNQALSVRRATNVKSALVQQGIPENQITIRGLGETQPLVPTADGVREPQNRRVEIVLQ